MKRYLILLLVILTSRVIYPGPNIYTTLVIVEEDESGDQTDDNMPVTDGIMDAMWDYDQYVFFDMKIDKPLEIKDDKIDVYSFIRDAREASADTILCIKINYNSKIVENGLKITAESYYFNLFSLNNLDSLSAGKIKIDINEVIDVKNKNKYLKNIGNQILNDILK